MALAPTTKVADRKPNPKVFSLEKCEARVQDIYRQHAVEDIERNANVRYGLGIFEEYRWLCEELRKATDSQPRSGTSKEAA